MKPALSAEEWAEKSLTTFSDSDRVIASMPEDRHALAALCLYEQPFGFTQEDVKGLRWAATGSLLFGGALAELAERIEALLPPVAQEGA